MKKKYDYGQVMLATEEAIKSGKPEIAYIVTHTAEDDTHIKMSGKFPYTIGKDPHFFVHNVKLPVLWVHPDEGIQMGVFETKISKKKKLPKRKK
jgi:hypothetical protein